ncbi:MAG: hypothetical protein ACLUI3_02605 [Christensenellales bacterium]
MQRTFLAHVCAEPEAAILDEPANHLDLIYQKHIFFADRGVLKQPGRAVISTHDLSLAKIRQARRADGSRRCGAGKRRGDDARTAEAVYGMDVYGWMRDLGQWHKRRTKIGGEHAMKFFTCRICIWASR